MTRKLNIAYLVPEFPSQTHIFFWREIQALRQSGHNVFTVSTRKPEKIARHSFSRNACKTTHYTYPPRILPFIRPLLHPRRTAAMLRYIISLHESALKKKLRYCALIPCAYDLLTFCRHKKIDHLHIHSCADAAHLGALCRKAGGPGYSLTVHGDLPVYGTDHAAKAAQAAFVSVVCRPLVETVRATCHLPPEKTPLIWMGVDTDEFTPPETRDFAQRPFTIATVARLNPAKGHLYALEAVRRLKDSGMQIRYIIAGEGPFERAVRQKITDLQLDDCVTLCGPLDSTEVRELLQSVHLLLLPSCGIGEASPVCIMEAMSCGTPVISTVIGGTADMVEDDRTGFLVPQKDANAIADRITQLYNDPERCRTFGENARPAALEKYDCRVTAGQLLQEIIRYRKEK